MSTSDSPKLYIAGMGMVTPVGGNVAMTAAALEAKISGYKTSPYYTQQSKPITRLMKVIIITNSMTIL